MGLSGGACPQGNPVRGGPGGVLAPHRQPGLPVGLAQVWLHSVAGFSQIWQRSEVLGPSREKAGKLQAGLSPY